MLFQSSSPNAVLGLLVAGVMLLLYGVRLVTDAAEHATSAQIRRAFMTLSRYPLVAFGTGVLATAVTQSSSATSSLLVGLVNTQLIPLAVAIVALLGANVGSTFVVQLLALHITRYAPVLVGLGTCAALFTYRTPRRRLGQVFFAFGLIVLGLSALETGSQPIAASPITAVLLKALVGAPLVLLILGAVLAITFTSSAASIGLVLVLAANGTLPSVAALVLMLGANIGTTLTAMITSLSQGTVVGQRLALIHCTTKFIGALVMVVLLNPLAALLADVWPNPGAQVAMAHLGFNLALAVIFAPFSTPLARLVEKLLPERTSAVDSGPRYLTPEALATPAIALGQATREILRMADVVTEMLTRSIHAFEEGGTDIPASIAALDDQLDELETATKRYLTRLEKEKMTEEQAQRGIALLYIITDLEAIGDVIDKQMMQLARRRRQDQVIFSEKGWEDLIAYHSKIAEALQQVLAALANQDPTLAADFLAWKVRLHQEKRTLHLRHLLRLSSGVIPSISSSAIHLDLLNVMSQVLPHASNIAHVIQGDLQGAEKDMIR